MKARSNVLAAVLMTSGALLAAAAGFSVVRAADDSTSTSTAPPSGPRGHHGFGMGHLYSKLGLTTEQQTSIKSIITAAKPQLKALHEQMRANHLKLTQTQPDDPNYASVVAEVAAANASLASQRTSQGATIRSQIYAVLTPTQKAQLVSLEAQWAANPHTGQWRGSRAAPTPAAQ